MFSLGAQILILHAINWIGSTSETCHLGENSLISWNNKKQAIVALSTIEVEYVAASSCYAHVI